MLAKLTGASIISALLSVSVASFAAADGLNETFKPTVIAWAAGFHKGDTKPDKVAVDIEGIEKVTPIVVAACKNEPKASFWGKVDAEMKKIF